jgi:hypothetical protein
MILCKNLKLTIIRDEAGPEIHLSLRDDLSLKEVSLSYEVSQEQPGAMNSRRYYVREAMVIAMRRLVGAAVEEGLISDCPGAQMTLSTGTKVNPPITFSTDGDYE